MKHHGGARPKIFTNHEEKTEINGVRNQVPEEAVGRVKLVNQSHFIEFWIYSLYGKFYLKLESYASLATDAENPRNIYVVCPSKLYTKKIRAILLSSSPVLHRFSEIFGDGGLNQKKVCSSETSSFEGKNFLSHQRYCPARWIRPKLGSFDRTFLKESSRRGFSKIRPSPIE
jgi:hypothetical protein